MVSNISKNEAADFEILGKVVVSQLFKIFVYKATL